MKADAVFAQQLRKRTIQWVDDHGGSRADAAKLIGCGTSTLATFMDGGSLSPKLLAGILESVERQLAAGPGVTEWKQRSVFSVSDYQLDQIGKMLTPEQLKRLYDAVSISVHTGLMETAFAQFDQFLMPVVRELGFETAAEVRRERGKFSR